jgi:hypothetical protein
MSIVPPMFFYGFDVHRCLVYANPNRVAAPNRMLNLVLRIRQDIRNAWSMPRREKIEGQCSICTRLRGGVLARGEVDDGHLWKPIPRRRSRLGL